MVIQYNISAINSHRLLGFNSTATAKSLEKLASGFRINRAGDDAAGLAISEKMRGQIRGLSMAENNVLHGINLIQTAEGGLNETHAILQRMRELSVQSSNGTYQDSDREQITLELDALKSEITRIAESTHFNGIHMLAKEPAPAGGNATGGIVSASTTTITNPAEVLQKLGWPPQPSPISDMSMPYFAMDLRNFGPNPDIDFIFSRNSSGIWTLELRGAVNIAPVTLPLGNGAMDAVEIYRNGSEYIRMGCGSNFLNSVNAAADSDVINGQLVYRVTYAFWGGTFLHTFDPFTLVSASVTLNTPPPPPPPPIITSGGSTRTADSTATFRFRSGMPVSYYYLVLDGGNPPPADEDYIKTNGISGGNIGTSQQAVNLTGLTSGGKVVYIVAENSDGYSNILQITIPAYDPSNPPDPPPPPPPPQPPPPSKNSIILQVGANGGLDQRVTIEIKDMRARSLGIMGSIGNARSLAGQSLDDISIGTLESANAAIEVIDAATAMVSAHRAYLGAIQNRLEHTLNNLGVTKENLTAAESIIRDIDMAKEMMAFTISQILVQASQAMLAQTNQLPQGVLELLR